MRTRSLLVPAWGLVSLLGIFNAGCSRPADGGKGATSAENSSAPLAKSSAVVAASASVASASSVAAPTKPAPTILAQGKLTGFCEASAVIPWEGGYLVADNEEKDRLYSFDASMKPREHAFKPKYKVRDVEALVELASKKVVLIGSHSTDSKGHHEEKRNLVQVEGSDPRSLDLSGCAICMKARTTAPKEGGLSIEGAALWGGALWLGLRSPLDGKKAMLLRMSGDLAGSDPIKVEEIVRVDLGGHGVRDLALRDGQLFVLAGPADKKEVPHALYRLLDAKGSIELVASGLPERSEGITQATTANEWLVVTDGDGDPGTDCKPDAEWFRIRL